MKRAPTAKGRGSLALLRRRSGAGAPGLGALFVGSELVDGQGAAPEFGPVEGGDGRRAAFGHLDEGEAARAAGLALLDDLGAGHGTVPGEGLAQVGDCSFGGQVTDD